MLWGSTILTYACQSLSFNKRLLPMHFYLLPLLSVLTALCHVRAAPIDIAAASILRRLPPSKPEIAGLGGGADLPPWWREVWPSGYVPSPPPSFPPRLHVNGSGHSSLMATEPAHGVARRQIPSPPAVPALSPQAAPTPASSPPAAPAPSASSSSSTASPPPGPSPSSTPLTPPAPAPHANPGSILGLAYGGGAEAPWWARWLWHTR